MSCLQYRVIELEIDGQKCPFKDRSVFLLTEVTFLKGRKQKCPFPKIWWTEVSFSSSCVYLIYGQNGQNTSYSRYASYLPFQIRHSAVTRQIAIMGHKRMGWKTYGL